MDKKIKILKNGPYIVSGSVPLKQQIITPGENGNEYVDGKSFPLKSEYALCRCGHSKNMPFCDGTHAKIAFNGKETAHKSGYLDRAIVYEGSDVIMTDEEKLCAFARFCHKQSGSVWELIEESDDSEKRADLIAAACDCPSGRLVIWDKQTNEVIEPYFEPSIVLLEDPERECSGPIWVRGGIPIESSDGETYEVRNRVTLCRCGESYNKPFCDANHVPAGFKAE